LLILSGSMFLKILLFSLFLSLIDGFDSLSAQDFLASNKVIDLLEYSSSLEASKSILDRHVHDTASLRSVALLSMGSQIIPTHSVQALLEAMGMGEDEITHMHEHAEDEVMEDRKHYRTLLVGAMIAAGWIPPMGIGGMGLLMGVASQGAMLEAAHYAFETALAVGGVLALGTLIFGGIYLKIAEPGKRAYMRRLADSIGLQEGQLPNYECIHHLSSRVSSGSES
jgi:hypothetical protein